MRLLPIAVLAVLGTAILPRAVRADGAPDAPYEADEHTLFLYHFDGATTAAFARGNAEPTSPPGERQFVEGVFGQALMFTRSERGLLFGTPGNYDPAQGTIELFVREPDLGVAGFASNRGYWQTHGGEALEQVRFVIGRGNFNTARTGTRVDDLFADIVDGQLGLKHSVPDWTAERGARAWADRRPGAARPAASPGRNRDCSPVEATGVPTRPRR